MNIYRKKQTPIPRTRERQKVNYLEGIKRFHILALHNIRRSILHLIFLSNIQVNKLKKPSPLQRLCLGILSSLPNIVPQEQLVEAGSFYFPTILNHTL